MRCYIFDIDGTVADLSHRLHHIRDPLDTPHGWLAAPPGTPEWKGPDWPAFFALCDGDAPISHMCELAHKLSYAEFVLFVSGRSDECREATERWLQKHVAPAGGPKVFMRKAGDHRPDNIVKAELLDRITAEGFRPIMAFEDRDQVVKMWRSRGVPCAQVAEGKF